MNYLSKKIDEEFSSKNEQILIEINLILNINCFYFINDVLSDCLIRGLFEIVKNPHGEDQCETHGPFYNIFVDEWVISIENWHFEGYIYAQFEENSWLKIPFCKNHD